MIVTLHDATAAELQLVRNLVPYYVYDMSEHMGWPCSADGRFNGCDGIESFWSTPGRFAFVLRSGDEPAGFAMVRGDYDDDDDENDGARVGNAPPERGPRAGVDYSIAECFVLRKFRRRGPAAG